MAYIGSGISKFNTADGLTVSGDADIDGAVDMASTLTLAGNADFNGNLDVDGTTDLDTTNVVGAFTVTGDVTLNDGSPNLRLNDTDVSRFVDILYGTRVATLRNTMASGEDIDTVEPSMVFSFKDDSETRTALTLDHDANVIAASKIGVGATPNTTFGSLLYAQGTPAANKPIISGYSTGNSNNAGIALFNDAGNRGIWTTGSTMRFTRTYEGNSTADVTIDASGVVTVGKTDAGSDVAGATIRGNGQASFTKASDGPLVLNRKTNQGYIALFQYDNTSIGQIGVDGSDNFYITGQAGNTGGFYFNDAALSPAYQGAERDNYYDLGKSGARFDDIFATNATIQTSDQNEKQQIASLTDAEITAAKAISALFKTFKWNDKVEAKGDDARTHTGVIAQEVQTAMSNAGLDAADYAFWCSDTWTDDDGNSQTRMGIRYPELLAFIGAATEQRLASIETRLTALEAG